MKNSHMRIISAVLVFAMAISFASCTKNKGTDSAKGGLKSGDKIPEDAVWYDSTVIDVDLKIESERPVSSRWSELIGADDKWIVVFTQGGFATDSDLYETTDQFAVISVIDRATKENAGTFDLTDYFASNTYIDAAVYEDGKAKVYINKYFPANFTTKVNILEIDLSTGETKETPSEINDETESAKQTYRLGQYKLSAIAEWNTNSTIKLFIDYPDGGTQKIVIQEQGNDLYYVQGAALLDETTAMVFVYSDNGFKNYKLDLATGHFNEEDPEEYSWIDHYALERSVTCNDGNLYYSTPTGISKLDFMNKTANEVFNFSWCGINRSQLEGLQIAECTEDSIILCGDKSRESEYIAGDGGYIVAEFSRAEKNPNAGKTVLELYAPNGQTHNKVSDAILKYNGMDNGYFIVVSDRYNMSNVIDLSDDIYEDEYDLRLARSDMELSNQLAIDIMNGDGPDILMDVSCYDALNNPNYLADLSSYVDGLDPDKYFTNLFEASKKDGKLYQIPICFTVDGIHTSAKNAGSSGAGFTTEEYKDFLMNELNGRDVFTSGQTIYFAGLFNAMSDVFIKDGKADLSGPEFKELAGFVKDYVPENGVSLDWQTDTGNNEDVAVYTTCYGWSGYFYNVSKLKEDSTILGIPSTDGRGPMFGAYISVAVSKQSRNADACGEFVKLLLSDEIQEGLAMQENFVVSREAFRKGGMAAVEYFSGPDGDMLFGYDYDLGRVRKDHFKPSVKDIDCLEDIIMNCKRINSQDSAITVILIEEMQPYFMGQKDLDAVVAIAGDRIQKVLDERG